MCQAFVLVPSRKSQDLSLPELWLGYRGGRPPKILRKSYWGQEVLKAVADKLWELRECQFYGPQGDIPAYLDLPVVHIALHQVLVESIIPVRDGRGVVPIRAFKALTPTFKNLSVEQLHFHMARWARAALDVVQYACEELTADRALTMWTGR